MSDVLCYGPVQEFPFKGVTADQFSEEDLGAYKSAPLLAESSEVENEDDIY